MNDVVFRAFTVVPSGFVGQEIIGPNGCIVAWTIDVVMAQVICELLNENDEHLMKETKLCL